MMVHTTISLQIITLPRGNMPLDRFEHPGQFRGVQKVFTFLIECICIKMLKVLDGYCGSGGFLSKSMTNMIQESNGV